MCIVLAFGVSRNVHPLCIKMNENFIANTTILVSDHGPDISFCHQKHVKNNTISAIYCLFIFNCLDLLHHKLK